MANTVYPKAKQAILEGNFPDLLASNIKVALLDSTFYTPALATDEWFSDIPGAAVVAVGPQAFGVLPGMTGKTTTAPAAGVFDANDVTVPAVVGTNIDLVAIFEDTGVAATSRLLVLYDTVTGIPATPNGGPITIAWQNTADRIFTIAGTCP